MPQKKFLWVLIGALVVANLASLAQNVKLQNEARQDRAALAQNVQNGQVADFLRAFVNKVLLAKGEVSFDDRLLLENMVRNLNDNAILDEWEKFVNSQTPAAAQEEVKNLLALLARKINIPAQ
jgi:hypothetical protein